MDELAEYVVKAKDYGDQVLAFLQELTEVVKVSPRCALVVTLPSSAPYGEEGERALQQLQRIFGRVETIFEGWSTFPTFQRTRGVLRFLAEVVADLYRKEYPAPLIQPAHLDLTNPAIRRELVKHIGNEYEGAIAADIADSNARAQKIDREMGDEYARFRVAAGLATAIFFYSFRAANGGASRPGGCAWPSCGRRFPRPRRDPLPHLQEHPRAYQCSNKDARSEPRSEAEWRPQGPERRSAGATCLTTNEQY